MNENLEKLESFFQENLIIKKELFNLAMNEQDEYNEESIIKYSDKLYESIKYLEISIIKMLKDFEFSDQSINIIKNKFDVYKNLIANCKSNSKKLRQFYNDCLAYMRPEFIDETKTNCIGYFIRRNNEGILAKSNTINEMLHLIHSYVMNNENIYQSLPVLSTKKKTDYFNISLYGQESPLAAAIYNSIDMDFPSDIVDIVGLSNGKIILMARDLGHALSVEITKEKDNYKVEYYIPKICNMEMINELPGINKITEESKYATGMFITNEEFIVDNLIQFMKNVPSDIHMNIER